MMAVTFGGCRGWFHPALPATRLRRGVVFCSPFGCESLFTYRGMRDLAEIMTSQGLPVLRFDYLGAGDSAGDDAPGRIADWLDSIEAAVDWLRWQVGVEQVSLCGLRLGATLAAAAAARRPGLAESLMLLAPIGSGRVHERELTLIAEAGAGTEDSPTWLEVAGFRLHATDRQKLLELDLAASLATAQPQRVLVVAPPRRPALSGPARIRLQASGVALHDMVFDGYEAFMRMSHESVPPTALFQRIAAWTAAGGIRAPLPHSEPRPEDRLECGGGVTERVLRFGPGRELIGVLCEPGTAQPGASVLILNTGANHRIGNGRFGVRLARHLAGLGVTSLRIDGACIGDSAGRSELDAADMGTRLFGDAPLNDVRDALDALEALGFARSILVGVCSGAHKAFQAALRDPRIVGLALANLPAFDRAAGGAPALDGGPPPAEHPLLRRPRMLVRRLQAEADRLLAEWLCLETGLNRAGRWMRDLQRRGTTLLLVYARDDRSLRELRAHFGRRGRHLPHLGPIRCVVLPETEHALEPRVMQSAFIAELEQHLRQYHGLGQAANGVTPSVAAAAESRVAAIGRRMATGAASPMNEVWNPGT